MLSISLFDLDVCACVVLWSGEASYRIAFTEKNRVRVDWNCSSILFVYARLSAIPFIIRFAITIYRE